MKNKIKYCFNKAAHSYDQNNHVQNKIGDLLIDRIITSNIVHPETILDVGCGTGFVTVKLVQHFSEAHIQAIDIADRLLLQAKQRLLPHQSAVCVADYDCLPLCDETVDLVFSNMALHWSIGFKETLQEITRVIRPQGWLAFSLALPGTFAELHPAAVNHFISADAVINWLCQDQYEILQHHQERITTTFADPVAALRSIKNVGANYVSQRKYKRDSSIALIRQSMRGFSLTYVVGLFIARKTCR